MNIRGDKVKALNAANARYIRVAREVANKYRCLL
jgi:hypothetical protein